jgi:hypothetical protein
VIAVVREVASLAKVGLKPEVLSDQVTRLLSSWPVGVTAAVMTERLKANKGKVRNPSPFLARDLSGIDPATYQLPEAERALVAEADAQRAQEAEEEAAWGPVTAAVDTITAQLQQVDPERAEAFRVRVAKVRASRFAPEDQRDILRERIEEQRAFLADHEQSASTKEEQP